VRGGRCEFGGLTAAAGAGMRFENWAWKMVSARTDAGGRRRSREEGGIGPWPLFFFFFVSFSSSLSVIRVLGVLWRTQFLCR
jgi:hypothetical protein